MTINASNTEPSTRIDAAIAAPAVDLALDTLNEILNGEASRAQRARGVVAIVSDGRALPAVGISPGYQARTVPQLTSCGAPPEYESCRYLVKRRQRVRGRGESRRRLSRLRLVVTHTAFVKVDDEPPNVIDTAR
ncbi:MAG: hypothetical protein ABIQ73_18410 [Acidimicrobiales bacterium]